MLEVRANILHFELFLNGLFISEQTYMQWLEK